MKWTVEKANKMLEELKIQKRANETNLNEMAKLIRRTLRKQGTSIRFEGGKLRETKKTRAARERKETTMPKRGKIEGPIGEMVLFLDNLELDINLKTPRIIEIGGANKTMTKDIIAKAKSLGLMIESEETGWIRIRREEKGRLEKPIIQEAYRRASKQGKAYILRKLASLGMGPNRTSMFLDEDKHVINDLLLKFISEDSKSEKTFESIFS